MIYLGKQDWSAKYNLLNDEVSDDFYKFETLPFYNDYGIYDWDAVTNTEMAALITKSQNAIYPSGEYIRSQISRGVKVRRVRYLSFPLSKYALRQFSVYKVYREFGVEIDVLEKNNLLKTEKANYFRDFLIFDNRHLLLIDNPNGCFNGGLYSDNIDEIQPFIDIRNAIEEDLTPFDTYLSNFNINNSILINH